MIDCHNYTSLVRVFLIIKSRKSPFQFYSQICLSRSPHRHSNFNFIEKFNENFYLLRFLNRHLYITIFVYIRSVDSWPRIDLYINCDWRRNALPSNVLGIVKWKLYWALGKWYYLSIGPQASPHHLCSIEDNITLIL